MKTQIQLAALALLLATFHSQLSTAFGQGVLTPPGAPAPTMRSLDQVYGRTDARTALTNSGAVTISQPGSYYLTTNLAVSSGNAITIATNQVTLDLNGFTLSSTEASPVGYGILLSGGARRDIQIFNGHIKGNVMVSGGIYSGNGFGYGIGYDVSVPSNVRVSSLSVSGCLYDGIRIEDDSTVVESCTVRTVGNYGIIASSVLRCTAFEIGSTAINAITASDCFGSSPGGNGLFVNGTASNCSGVSSSGTGLYAETAINCSGITSGSDTSDEGLSAFNASNCIGVSTGGTGLSATTANGCYGQSTSGDGIFARTASNCYGVSSNGIGLKVLHAANGCYGQSTSSHGLYTFGFGGTANNCYGISSGSGIGIYVDVANSCWGKSANSQGINARTANNCYGESQFNRGIFVDLATGCYGVSQGASYGIFANRIAIGCYGSSVTGVGVNAPIVNSCSGTSVGYTYKYNMP